MELTEIQKKVDLQITSYGTYWHPLSMMLRLIEEMGELARAINIKYGEKKAKSSSDGREIEAELADVFYASVAMANFYNVNLNNRIIEKLNSEELNENENLQKFKENENLEAIQSKFRRLKKDNMNYLSIGLKLDKEIGIFAELISVTYEKEIDIIPIEYISESITNIVIKIIGIATMFDIDLAKEISIKMEADEVKMTNTYKK